jgi:hypothetical protein
VAEGHAGRAIARASPDAFIDTQRTRCSIASLCRRYHVTTAGFYAWLGREESAHAKQLMRAGGLRAKAVRGYRAKMNSPAGELGR